MAAIILYSREKTLTMAQLIEDADFIFRLQHNGIVRKSGSWSTEVFHLFHRIHDQSNAAENARCVREKIVSKVNSPNR